MVSQIGGLDKFNIRELGANFVGMGINPVDQNADKQEIRKDNNPLIAQLHRFAQPGIDARMCNPGIADFNPAKAHAFLQYARHFIDIGIGIRVVGAPPDNHQKRIFAGNACIGGCQRFFNAIGTGAQQFRVNRQVTTEFYDNIGVFTIKIIDLAGQVIFDMTGGKQHTWQRVDLFMAQGFEFFKPVAQNRVGKFQKTAFDIVIGEMGVFHLFNHVVEL